MDILSNSNDFLEKIKLLKKDLESFQNTLDQKGKNIENTVNNLSNFKNSSNSTKNKLDNLLEITFSVYYEDIRNFQNKIKEYKNGIEFIKHYEKSIIIFVFGKVKAGKSSLGNYILGDDFRKNYKESLYNSIKKPTIEIFDNGKISYENELAEFEVKTTEATNKIQTFILEGMAWVDTPGIGSLTGENQKKAEEYVQHADMVLYLTSSDSVGRQQDFEELKYLKNINKPVLLVISKSDTPEEDEINGKLVQTFVAKSDKDRKDQENYLLEELKKAKLDYVLKHSSILTTSVKLAKIGIKENNSDKYKQSNMNIFFEKLGNVISEKTIEFKKENPKKKINTLIQYIINGSEYENFKGLTEQKKSFENVKKETELKINELKALKEKILKKALTDSETLIDNYIIKKEMLFKESKEEKNIDDVFFNELKNVIINILNSEIKELLVNFNKTNIANFNLDFNIKFEKKYQTIEKEITEYSYYTREASGFWETVKSWFGAEYYSSRSNKKTIKEDIEVGTNKKDISNELKKSLPASYNQIINKEIDEIENKYFNPILTTVKNGIEHINLSIKELEKQNY